MEVKAGRNISSGSNSSSTTQSDDYLDLRRGPWTVEEDFKLINYIANHGEGRWNSLARCAGLKRTGKSCRLRWLNYLRPDVRRGNITLEEQLLILELHSRWGNRWSKIAQHLPGRTDNEIKNYWRTRVQKHAKQLKCDVNSKQFKDTVRYLWMPRLIERIQAANANNSNIAPAIATGTSSGSLCTITTAMPAATATSNIAKNTSCFINTINDHVGTAGHMIMPINNSTIGTTNDHFNGSQITTSYTPENSSTAASSDSFGTQVSPVSDLTDYYNIPVNNSNPDPEYGPFQAAAANCCQVSNFSESSLISPTGYFIPGIDFQAAMEANNNQLMDGGDASDNLWNVDDIWFLQQQFNSNM